jgi:hypothetical protein
MIEIIVEEGMSIWDVTVRYYGDVASVTKLLADNDLTYNSDLLAGQTLLIRESNNSTVSAVTEYFNKNKTTINNSINDIPVLLPVSPLNYVTVENVIKVREVVSTWVVQEGQSSYDICTQLYGDVEKINILFADNDISYNDTLEAGRVLTIRPELVVLQKDQTVINNDDNIDRLSGELRIVLLKVEPETNYNQGYILIDVLGGVLPYTFEWYNSNNELIRTLQNLTNIPSDTYTVYVTDAENTIVSLTVYVTAIYIEFYLIDHFGEKVMDESGDFILSIE